MKSVTFDTIITDLPWTGEQNVLPAHNAFFLSFTDGLRHLLQKEGLQKSDTILIPEFYCPDTAYALMTCHNVSFYRVHDDLTIDEVDFIRQLAREKPKAVVLYSFFGGSISTDLYDILRKKYSDTLVIDDYAHRWLRSSTLKWLHPKHIYIDSIRKHTPFLGAHVVSEYNRELTAYSVSVYAISCHILRLSENIINVLARLAGSARLREISDNLFEALDARIGRSDVPAGGGMVAKVLWSYIDTKKVHVHLSVLKKRYATLLSSSQSALIKKYEISYLPLRIEHSTMDSAINTLAARGISADQLWEYEVWMPARAKKLYDSVAILPLTMAMREEDITMICKTIETII